MTEDELLKLALNEITYKGNIITIKELSILAYGVYKKKDLTLHKVVKQVKQLEVDYLLNKYKYSYSDNVWKIYSKTTKGKLIYRVFDFNKLTNKLYIAEVKRYINVDLNQGTFNYIVKVLNTFDHYVPIVNINLQDVTYIFNTLSKCTEVNTLRKIFTACSKMYKYLYPNKDNPFTKIRFNNSDLFNKSTKVIPKHVLDLLSDAHNYSDSKYHLMFEVLRDTGLRFSEVANLRMSDVVGRVDDYYKVRYVPYKIQKYTRQKYSYVYIHKRLVSRFEGEPYIFNINSNTFNDKINNILVKHNIDWKFTSRQLRKTLATNLINKGATVQEVATQLNHLKYSTTEQYYIEVNNMELAKKNSKFYMDNMSLVECTTTNDNSCAFCPKLCTNIKYIDGWISLQDKALKEGNTKLANQCELIIQKIRGDI